MTLSKEQIDQLFIFVEKKFVHWYDLQVELVDHLANKIEEELELNPSYTFEFALQKVYGSFGIFGFARIVREKEEQVRKQNNKLWVQEFKKQFVWPNLVRSMALLLIIFTLVNLINYEYIFLVGLLLVAINFKIQIFRKKKQAKTNKHLLLTQYYLMPNVFSFIYFQSFLYLNNFWNEEQIAYPYNYLFIGLIFLTTLSYLASLQLANKMYLKGKEMYPEAFEIGRLTTLQN
jgi:hypothetical protein